MSSTIFWDGWLWTSRSTGDASPGVTAPCSRPNEPASREQKPRERVRMPTVILRVPFTPLMKFQGSVSSCPQNAGTTWGHTRVIRRGNVSHMAITKSKSLDTEVVSVCNGTSLSSVLPSTASFPRSALPSRLPPAPLRSRTSRLMLIVRATRPACLCPPCTRKEENAALGTTFTS